MDVIDLRIAGPVFPFAGFYDDGIGGANCGAHAASDAKLLALLVHQELMHSAPSIGYGALLFRILNGDSLLQCMLQGHAKTLENFKQKHLSEQVARC